MFKTIGTMVGVLGLALGLGAIVYGTSGARQASILLAAQKTQSPQEPVNVYVAPRVGGEEGGGTIFERPVPIVWSGKIISWMAGGDSYAIERVPSDPDEPNFLAEFSVGVLPGPTLSGVVRVTGLYTGTTCAYQRTVFGGRCVPHVEIQSIEQIAE